MSYFISQCIHITRADSSTQLYMEKIRILCSFTLCAVRGDNAMLHLCVSSHKCSELVVVGDYKIYSRMKYMSLIIYITKFIKLDTSYSLDTST